VAPPTKQYSDAGNIPAGKITGITDLNKLQCSRYFCELVVISSSLHCQLLRLHAMNNVEEEK
jgi:hypothetical protein